ncbi:MAG TPA: copper chaperone PCu(A)C [Gammaproteobacteria bacterium]
MTLKRIFPLLLLVFINPSHAGEMLAFQNTYIIAAPPGVETMAAYLTVINSGKRDKKIVRIDSHQFESAEIHRSTVEAGVAKMEKLDILQVPANSMVELSPGGLHIMLIGPKQPVLPGEFVILRLEEADGTEHNLAVKVIFTAMDRKEHEHH